MKRDKAFLRARRGGVIIEFSFSALLLILALMTTLEFGIEVFVRQSVERAAGIAVTTYAATRSPQAAEDAVTKETIKVVRNCIKPLDIVIHNNISSLKNGSGREAKGNSSDDGARVARITLTCEWDRLTPLQRSVMGAKMIHQTTSFVRIRK